MSSDPFNWLMLHLRPGIVAMLSPNVCRSVGHEWFGFGGSRPLILDFDPMSHLSHTRSYCTPRPGGKGSVLEVAPKALNRRGRVDCVRLRRLNGPNPSSRGGVGRRRLTSV